MLGGQRSALPGDCRHRQLRPLLPPPATPAQLRLSTTAKLRRCALASPAAQPPQDSSGTSIRRDTTPTPAGRQRARQLLGAQGCRAALTSPRASPRPQPISRSSCMNKQICLQRGTASVCLSVRQHPPVKERAAQEGGTQRARSLCGHPSPRNKDTARIR